MGDPESEEWSSPPGDIAKDVWALVDALANDTLSQRAQTMFKMAMRDFFGVFIDGTDGWRESHCLVCRSPVHEHSIGPGSVWCPPRFVGNVISSNVTLAGFEI